MNLDRQMVAQIIIMFAACIGGWVIIVDPQAKELHKLEEIIAEARSNPLLQSEGSIELMANRLHGVRLRVEEIERQNEFARDTSRIYELIMETAADEGVTVQRLDPRARQKTGGDDVVEVISFEMWVEGAYERVARFVTAVEEIDGFVRHVSLLLTPRQSEGRSYVEARITCEAMSFPLPEALATMLGEEDADQ